jgi:hypothetical protein
MPTYLDLSRKNMPSPKTMTHPLAIRYEAESWIETIETANQNLAQNIVEERKIKGEKTKKTINLLKGRPRSSSPPTGRLEARGMGAEGGGCGGVAPREGADGARGSCSDPVVIVFSGISMAGPQIRIVLLCT